MKFRSPKFTWLRVHGVGQFVDGVLEVTDPEAIRRVEEIAEPYGITAVDDDPADEEDPKPRPRRRAGAAAGAEG